LAYLSEMTERVIREEVHGETSKAEEIDELARIGCDNDIVHLVVTSTLTGQGLV